MAAAESGTSARFSTMPSFLLLLVLLVATPSSAQQPPSATSTCTGLTFSQGRTFARCNPLPRLRATLHWTYTASNGTVRLAFRAPHTTNGWVAWALNPTGTGMPGAQALVAIFNATDNNRIRAYTTQIPDKQPDMRPAPLTFPVSDLAADYIDGAMTIFATVTLPGGRTSINHLWQSSTNVADNGFPAAHDFGPENTKSLGTVDFMSGQASDAQPPSSTPSSPQQPPTTPSSALQPPSTASSTCTGLTFSQGRTFARCNPLPRLRATLHWTYTASNGTVRLAFRAPQSPNGWVAWALNPTGTGMPGAQALVAIFNSSNNNQIQAYTTPISNKQPSMRPAPLTFPVKDLVADYMDGAMTIFATVTLPGGRTSINHLWQASTSVADGFPASHPFGPENTGSLGTVDFLSGQVSGGSGGGSKLRRKNTHGVLNAVSWGVLMPIGAIIARYLRVFESADPAWFYIHVACQCSAYVVGVAGWGTGMKLGSESEGIKYNTHRNLGITLFTFATLQVFALLLRPNKDHKYRIFWNAYHHSIGYAILAISAVNIFKGFDILNPDKGWKRAYIGILIGLGAVALVLEATTWAVVIKRKQRTSQINKNTNGHAGRPGSNGGV